MNNLTTFDSFREKISEFTQYPYGWDSYEAEPLSNKTASYAFDFIDKLELESLVPNTVSLTPDNTVIIELESGEFKCIIEIHEDGDVATATSYDGGDYSYCDLKIEEMCDHFSTDSLRILNGWFKLPLQIKVGELLTYLPYIPKKVDNP